MANEIEKIKDPGLPAHKHRKADLDPKAADRAERQVSVLFLLSGAGTALFIFAFLFVKTDTFVYLPILGTTNAHQLFLGLGMAASLFFIGMGMVHWAKTLMSDTEVIAERHEFRSSDEDRQSFVDTVKEQASTAGLGRRKLIKRSLGFAGLLAALPGVLILRDLGPLPRKSLNKTNWDKGVRLVTDPGYRPIKASDLEVGAVAQVLPELPEGTERTLENIGTDAVLLIRIRPEEFQLNAERLSWTHEGIIAFSKICSHMGCAVALYEQQTKHLLCPCHQSTFDVTRAAKVIFGPAARPLPQLAITVDAEGYLVAQAPFNEPIGPSFWERSS